MTQTANHRSVKEMPACQITVTINPQDDRHCGKCDFTATKSVMYAGTVYYCRFFGDDIDNNRRCQKCKDAEAAAKAAKT